MLIEINWNNFKTKFSSQEQAAFEHLCYLLFCNEFGKQTGISRFKNHAGVETNPIEANGQSIGWQARFYSTSLSEHKKDFTDSIDKAKARHPQITKIIFYTNQDFGQNAKGTDPQYKTEIEDHARTVGIEIEWRTASYFESPFVREQNFSIAQYYFSPIKGILDAIAEMTRSTKEIFKPINSEISFGTKQIKIDRADVINSLKALTDNPSIVILCGEAGVGKTAIAKDFYQTVEETAPLFVFKATQLKNATYVNQLFKNYGEITAAEFIQEHKDVPKKYVIIDSAERLSEIEDQDAFRALLFTFLENGWSVIFTVRHSYLDDLRFQLKEVYNTGFTSIEIPKLEREKLDELTTEHSFSLPSNDRVIDLLKTPLYLSEYLKNYGSIKANTTYADFRDLIWKKQIQDSGHQSSNIHRRREACFLSIAKKRANDGGFFVGGENLDQEALQKLEADEIIKYDPSARGYFITHDVYEEWALEKFLEQSFTGAKDFRSFFEEIGSSLPSRRAFRNWLSDKLFADRATTQRLIEFTIKDESVENHWKDEALVSVLLSDYSANFFQDFEKELLAEAVSQTPDGGVPKTGQGSESNKKPEELLLNRILFLLRVSCKAIDETFLRMLGIKAGGALSLKTVFTAPKGSGWDSAIAFINTHRETLQLRHMRVILPVLHDWNSKHKSGETTRHAGQMTLFYYEELTKNEHFYFGSRDDLKEKLLGTTLSASSEIKGELTAIVDKVISEGNTDHRSRYYELANAMLASVMESAEVAKQLPKEVLRLADFFWLDIPEDTESRNFGYSTSMETYFGLSGGFRYYPSSAFQTPMWMVLQTDLQAAVDFLLSFTDRSIEYFSKSRIGKDEAEEIDVVVDDAGTTIKQYACHRIWNMYRGTQTDPDLLESIHMALEKRLLELAKTATPEVTESWCFYLLRNSRSTSMSAIVVSVVLAEPSKLFNVACVLFRTKDLFFFDMARMRLDAQAKSLYQIASDGFYKNERLQTCDEKHRQQSLEDLALRYQFFATEIEGEEVAKQRQKVIWKIFDEHYKVLPEKSVETDIDKTWRLCLARMDRRKMNITTEAKDEGILINFNPEIDPELKKYSEDSQAKALESMKHLGLLAWARAKLEGNPDSKKYPQYENDPNRVFSEMCQVLECLTDDRSEDRSFTLLNHTTPTFICAVLVRDYFDQLSQEEKARCRDILIGQATAPFKKGYSYQVGGGGIQAITSLPLLMKMFPEQSSEIKILLLMNFFDSRFIGMSQQLSDYPMAAIMNSMWNDSPEDAKSIFLGFLMLKPLYNSLSEAIRRENFEHNVYESSGPMLLERFFQKYEREIERFASNEASYSEISGIDQMNLDTLVNAFCLIPSDTSDEVHKSFMHQIFPIFAAKIFNDDRAGGRDDAFHHGSKHRFLEKLALVLLLARPEDAGSYLKPYVDNLKDSEGLAQLFSELITAEDSLNRYEQFWAIWNLFYPKVVEIAKTGSRWGSQESIRNYLLAWNWWNKDAREWHTLKDREKIFFKRVCEDMGQNPTVLLSISRLLNEIGAGFQKDGIIWISDMLKRNPGLSTSELEVNTVYYMENLLRGYVIKNRHKIKTTLELKTKILIVMDFLLEKGSATAYLLREDIL